MIHTSKTKEDYLHFSQSIEIFYETNREKFKKLQTSIKEVKKIITDDDRALHGALKAF